MLFQEPIPSSLQQTANVVFILLFDQDFDTCAISADLLSLTSAIGSLLKRGNIEKKNLNNFMLSYSNTSNIFIILTLLGIVSLPRAHFNPGLFVWVKMSPIRVGEQKMYYLLV